MVHQSIKTNTAINFYLLNIIYTTEKMSLLKQNDFFLHYIVKSLNANLMLKARMQNKIKYSHRRKYFKNLQIVIEHLVALS